MKCDVCKKEGQTYEASSNLVNFINHNYCHVCLEEMVEPYHFIISYVLTFGSESINDEKIEVVERTLKKLNIPPQQFEDDVNQTIQEVGMFLKGVQSYLDTMYPNREIEV